MGTRLLSGTRKGNVGSIPAGETSQKETDSMAQKNFERIVQKLNDSNPSKLDGGEPTLDDIAVAVALWALQRGHDKEATVAAIEQAFDAIEG